MTKESTDHEEEVEITTHETMEFNLESQKDAAVVPKNVLRERPLESNNAVSVGLRRPWRKLFHARQHAHL
jgi:hypothetical protein